jgi:hypothetical protein
MTTSTTHPPAAAPTHLGGDQPTHRSTAISGPHPVRAGDPTAVGAGIHQPANRHTAVPAPKDGAHAEHIPRKLDVHDRVAAATKAHRLGLVD